MKDKPDKIRFVSDLNNLILKVFIVGYSSKGESVILLVCDSGKDNEVNYSAVIDCFESDDINKTVDVLLANKVKAVDLLCWSHPDDDHTKGLIDVIDKFCSSKTKIILPEGVYGSDKDLFDYDDYQRSIFDAIKSANTGINYRVASVSVDDYERLVHDMTIQDLKANLKIKVVSYAPHSSIIRRRYTVDKKPLKNDFSIALLFHIGSNLNLFFSGDIEDQSIRLMSNEGFDKKLDLLKTPHHTSSSSKLLLKFLDDNITQIEDIKNIKHSCTTVFKQNDLPDNDIVKEYKKRSADFHSTGMKHDANDSNYGIIEYEFGIVSRKSTCTLVGNAEVL